MMEILYLHQHFSTPQGAAPMRSYAMAQALIRRGHRVTVLCGAAQGGVSGVKGAFRRGVRCGDVDGIRVVQFDIPYANAMNALARSRAFLHFAWRAARWALKARPDLVFASSTPPSVAIPALLLRARHGTPFVFETRDPWPELLLAMGALRRGGAAWGLARLSALACRHAAHVVALSEGMADIARQRGARAVSVIPNACDLDVFGPHISPVRPPGIAEGQAMFVYAGAHGPANGLDLLLDAAAVLQRRGIGDVCLVLVGQGGEKPRLMARAAAEGLRLVRFLDPLPKPRLAELFAAARGGLMCLAPVTAFAELTSPNKLMDMLAAGVPVVSNVPGRAARWLAEAGCGVTLTQAETIADALTGLARDPGRARTMGEAGRRFAMARFDRRDLAAQLCEVIEEARDAA